MKKSIKMAVITVIGLMSTHLSTVMAQDEVSPTTTKVSLFCSGSDLNLGAPEEGTQWIVNYSATPTDTPTEGVELTGTTIPAAILKTGYYYVAAVGIAEGSCQSEMEELPVYVFKPLTVEFTPTGDSYCIEDVAAQTFTANVTATGEAYTTYTYQWYTVSGETETVISGATAATYKPAASVAAGTTTTYRLRAGYLVNGLRYCSDTFDKEITVTAKPDKPTIIIEGSAGETL